MEFFTENLALFVALLGGLVAAFFGIRKRSGGDDNRRNLDRVREELDSEKAGVRSEREAVEREKRRVDAERGAIREESAILERDRELVNELKKRLEK